MIVNISDCIENIIGLSQTVCDCYPDPPPGYNTSPSPYFVDDAKYGIHLSLLGGDNCNGGGIWDKLLKARKEGAEAFISAFLMSLSDYTRKGRHSWSGDVGGKFNGALQLSGTHAGILIEPHCIKGGYITIDCIGLAMSCTQFFDVDVYDVSNCPSTLAELTPLASIPVEAREGQKVIVDLDTPLRLPTSDKKGRKKKYLFVYDRAGCFPMNVEYHCNCGGGRPGYYDFMNVSGVSGSTSAELCNGMKDRSRTNGFCLGLSFDCSGIDFLCKSWDYNNDPFARVLAQTVQLFSIQCLTISLLTSPKLDPAVQCNRESMIQTIQNVEGIIEHNVAWLAQNLPEGATDCYQCQAAGGLTKNGIYV